MYGSEVQTFFGLLDVVLNFKYYTSTLYGKGGGVVIQDHSKVF